MGSGSLGTTPGQTSAVISSSTSGLFCVFDGHGGIEVAEFCSRHFEAALKANPHYQALNYELALQETFLRMDEMLMTPEGKAEIQEINKQFPANVSQLEKALVASGNIKGKPYSNSAYLTPS